MSSMTLKEILAIRAKKNIARTRTLASKGRKRVECKTCAGTGIKEQGFTDYDGSGSFYVPSTYCGHCGGGGTTEIKCSKQEKVDALRELLTIAEEDLKKELK